MAIENYPTFELLQQFEKNWPEAVTPITELMLRVFRLNKIILESSQDLTQKFGLSYNEFLLLTTLRRQASPYKMLPGDIGKAMFLTSGGLTKMLDRLEKQNLIKRVCNENDLRCKPVKLSKKGKDKVEIVLTALLEKDKNYLNKGLSKKQISQFNNILTELLLELEKTL